MLQINSSEKFPIVRKLSDPSDSGTYYVRAVIRNSISGATIDTVNLTNDGLGIHRFAGTFVAPTDASGQGLWIDVVTKVYSDSGYTTQDTIYSDEVETYLVQERFNHNLANQFGGPVGPDVDYKKIKKIVEEVIGTPKEVDLSQLNNKLDEISGKIKPVEIPESDYSQIISAIADVKSYISSVPGIDKIDFSGIVSRIDEMKLEIEEREMEKEEKRGERDSEGMRYREESMAKKEAFHKEIKDELGKIMSRIEELASSMSEKEIIFKLNLPGSQKKEQEKTSRLSDIMNRLR